MIDFYSFSIVRGIERGRFRFWEIFWVSTRGSGKRVAVSRVSRVRFEEKFGFVLLGDKGLSRGDFLADGVSGEILVDLGEGEFVGFRGGGFRRILRWDVLRGLEGCGLGDEGLRLETGVLLVEVGEVARLGYEGEIVLLVVLLGFVLGGVVFVEGFFLDSGYKD